MLRWCHTYKAGIIEQGVGGKARTGRRVGGRMDEGSEGGKCEEHWSRDTLVSLSLCLSLSGSSLSLSLSLTLSLSFLP